MKLCFCLKLVFAKKSFSPEVSVFVNFDVIFCKNRAFLPYVSVFGQISLRSCEKHVVSASLQHFGSYLGKKMDKSAEYKFFFSVFKVFFCLNFYCKHSVLAGFQCFFADSIAFLLKTFV